MLIRKIILKNFRQYYDENTITLSTDEKKNVTVIRGENGVGKTALLNSLKWAFFGNFTDNFRNPTDLINNTALTQGVKACSVEVEFIEDDQLFHLIRRFDNSSKKTELKVFRITDGVFSASLPEPDLVINGMLPKEMGEYFFFQGEGSNAVITGNSSGNMAQAIRDILGFKVAIKLTESLKKLVSENRRLISSQDTSGKSSKLNNDLENIEKSVNRFSEKIDEINNRLPKIKSDLEDVNSKLLKFSNFDLKKLKRDERDVTLQLNRKKGDLELLRKRRFSLINKYGWAVFGAKLSNKSQNFIDESALKGKLPEPYNQRFIEDILGKRECICGACLKEGSDAYNKVIGLLSKAANPKLQQRLSGIRAQISAINTLYNGAAEEISNTNKDFDSLEEEVLLLARKLESINEQIIDIPEEEISRLQRLKNKLDSDKDMLLLDLGNYKSQLDYNVVKKNSVLAELEKLVGSTSIITDLKLKQDFLNELHDYVEKYLADAENGIRLHVLDEVNKTLNLFSRHDFKIKVEPDSFRFHLLDKEDRPVGQGDGLNLLLNLTITASLIQFAATKKKAKDPILSSATVAPLVIDAPFGVLDNKYRNVVVELLPEYANQIIFLVSSSQWTDEMDSIIRDKIGKEYVLILEETSAQGSRSVDVIKTYGVEHVVSRYSCEVDRTLIQEVTANVVP